MKIFPFFGVALVITLPWLIHPGYLFFLDWSFTPLFGIDMGFVQKLIIFCTLILVGISTSTLIAFLLCSTIPLRIRTIIATTCGIIAMTNPFVFNRLHMGHVNLLLGYALSPLVLFFVYRFFSYPSKKNAIIASVIASITIICSVHYVILLPILIAICMWDRNYSLKVQPTLYTWLIAPYSAVLIGIVLLGINMHPIPVFNSQDLIAFAPQPQCTSSTFIDTVFLVAQWRNPHAVPLPCTFLPLFLIFNIAILLLLFIGGWKHKKLAIGAMLCIMLADIPLITAMRDSAKYIADLAIIEIILLGYAVAYIYNKTKNATLPWVVLVLVIVNGFPMYWGLSHTSTPASYPSSWYEWNKQLATLHEKPQVLFLPWHLYMPFDFTNQETIANPANIFFTNATIIRGDNLEMRQGTVSIYSESTSNLSREVEDALSGIHDLDFADRLSLLLTKENIKYVALASGSPEEAMYRETFNKIPSLSISYTAAGLTVWKFGE